MIGCVVCKRGEEVDVARLLLPGPPRKLNGERRVARGEVFEHRVDGLERFERVHSAGPGPYLAGRFRAPQHQGGQHGQVRLLHTHHLGQRVAISGRTPVRTRRRSDEPLALQALKRIHDVGLRVLDDGIAVRLLIARRDETIYRHGVVIRRAQLLLDETPHDARLALVELDLSVR